MCDAPNKTDASVLLSPFNADELTDVDRWGNWTGVKAHDVDSKQVAATNERTFMVFVLFWLDLKGGDGLEFLYLVSVCDRDIKKL